MTKSELINDVVWEMTGYLTPEGIDHMKTVLTVKLVNVNLVAAEHDQALHHTYKKILRRNRLKLSYLYRTRCDGLYRTPTL